MSNRVKCFDVVSMVTEEATRQFAPLWKENEECLDILKQYCKAIDSLAKEFDGISYDVSVDDIEMTISIKLECQDFEVGSKSHVFCQLAERAVSLGFTAADNGNLFVEFVFPSIWE